MKGWYNATVDHAPPPAWVNLGRITADRVELYLQVQPPRESISLSIEPFQMKESVSTEEEIEWVVWKLINNCSGVPSGMRADHIKGCLGEVRKVEAEVEEETEATGEPE